MVTDSLFNARHCNRSINASKFSTAPCCQTRIRLESFVESNTTEYAILAKQDVCPSSGWPHQLLRRCVNCNFSLVAQTVAHIFRQPGAFCLSYYGRWTDMLHNRPYIIQTHLQTRFISMWSSPRQFHHSIHSHFRLFSSTNVIIPIDPHST